MEDLADKIGTKIMVSSERPFKVGFKEVFPPHGRDLVTSSNPPFEPRE